MDAGECEGRHLDLGERPAHAVGVYAQYAHFRGDGVRDQGIHAADLDRHDGRELLAEVSGKCAYRGHELGAGRDLFDNDRRRADDSDRGNLGVVGQFLGIDEGDRPEILNGLANHKLSDVGVSAAAGTKQRGTQR
jgi:hypothetical protein